MYNLPFFSPSLKGCQIDSIRMMYLLVGWVLGSTNCNLVAGVVSLNNSVIVSCCQMFADLAEDGYAVVICTGHIQFNFAILFILHLLQSRSVLCRNLDLTLTVAGKLSF